MMAKVRDTRELLTELRKDVNSRLTAMDKLLADFESRLKALESRLKTLGDNFAALERSGRS